MNKYDVCILGLGPVGTISGACFAKQGFNVIGVDVNPDRVSTFAKGRAPFEEPGVDNLVGNVVKAGRFHATLDGEYAIANAHIIMIAVGTPTPEGAGEPDLSQLDAVSNAIGEAIRNKSDETIVVVRSTVPPGTMRNRIARIIENASGKEAGVGFHVAANPEFLREGKAIDDFFHTGRVVIGADTPHVAEAIERLYRDVEGLRLHTSIESAEFAKYVDNTWHALKVSFANEIGRVCKSFGGNLEETTEIFLSDPHLNISKYYLRPGFAFGGSCLPKDVRGLRSLAKRFDVNIPVIDAILDSNEEQIHQGAQAIFNTAARTVGLLGVAFKEHVDDLRESPALAVAAKLKAVGIAVLAHDPSYAPGTELPLPKSETALELVDLGTLTEASQTLVLMHDTPEYREVAAHHVATGGALVDLTTLKLTKPKSTVPAASAPSVKANGATRVSAIQEAA